MAPDNEAALRVRAGLSSSDSNSRTNSPSCGVRIACVPPMAANRVSGEPENTVSASASRTAGLPVARARDTSSRVSSETPAPRPDQRRRAPRIPEIVRENLRTLGFDDQRTDQPGRIDRPRLRRTEDARHAGTDPHGRPRREPGRAGHLGAAGDHRVAPAVFVIARPRPAQRTGPQIGFVGERGGADFVQHGVGNPDIGDMNVAHGKTPRIKEVPGFPAKKGDRQRGVRRGPPDFTGIAVDPARHVDGGAGALAYRLDRGARLPVHVADQPGAEYRVDDELRVSHRLRRHGVRPGRSSARH